MLDFKETLAYFWQHVIARLNGFFPATGGTISGDVTVTGTVTADKVIGAVYQ